MSSFGPNDHGHAGNGHSFASTGTEFQPSHSQSLAFHTHEQGNGNRKPEENIDDSGIGMSLMDEEMTFSKFTNPGGTGMQVDAL